MEGVTCLREASLRRRCWGCNSVLASIIIPTLNRSSMLRRTLESVLSQDCRGISYEIIVVDNGSTDDTRSVVESFNMQRAPADPRRIRYFYDEHPGLHICRHRGAEEAKGEFLIYADDDVVASPSWVRELVRCFRARKVGAVGGKVVPMWEAEPPSWAGVFGDYLSLLDLGRGVRKVDASKVYGCNMCVRKEALFEVGGFNPDSFPPRLVKYRGDGETALMSKLAGKGYVLLHNGNAVVRHIIPPSRLTTDYIKHRAFLQGISDSFAETRAAHGLDCATGKRQSSGNPVLRYLRSCGRRIKRVFGERGTPVNHPEFEGLREELHRSHAAGREFHQRALSEEPGLLDYVLRDNYLGENGRLPI